MGRVIWFRESDMLETTSQQLTQQIARLVYARSRPGEPPAAWEPLADLLHNVADLAGQFAGAFGADSLGELIGLWHNRRKYSAEFQAYLLASSGDDGSVEDSVGKVDLSSAGAQQANGVPDNVLPPQVKRLMA
jgi:hypothetical protein